MKRKLIARHETAPLFLYSPIKLATYSYDKDHLKHLYLLKKGCGTLSMGIVPRECSLTATGGTKNFGNIYPINFAIP